MSFVIGMAGGLIVSYLILWCRELSAVDYDPY